MNRKKTAPRPAVEKSPETTEKSREPERRKCRGIIINANVGV